MKMQKRFVNVEEYVYVSEDGKEFQTKEECEEYEYDLKYNDALERVKSIIQFDCDPPDGDMDCLYRWYFLENQENLDALRSCVFRDKDAFAYSFEAEKFPCWVRCLVYENGSGDIVSIEEHTKAVIDYLVYLNSTIGKKTPSTSAAEKLMYSEQTMRRKQRQR